MCGLSGVMSRYLSNGEINAFRDLTIVSTLRGDEGSGFIAVPQKTKHKIETWKTPLPACIAVYDDAFHHLTRRTVGVLMGHARLPTTGGSGETDLHPHHVDHIIGMHNGTVEEVCGTVVKKGTNDSRLLFGAIADVGIRQAVYNTRGAYALTWIDTKTETLNFLRNDKRPLYFGHSEFDTGTLYWASEPEMLEMVLDRYYGECKIMSLPPNMWVSFRMRIGGPVIKIIDRQYVAQSSDMTRDPKKEGTSAAKPNTPRASVPTVVPGTAVTTSPLKEQSVNDVHMSFNGQSLPFEEVRALLKKGCCNCSMPVTFTDLHQNKLHYTGVKEFVCSTCYANEPDAASMADAYSFQQRTGQQVH